MVGEIRDLETAEIAIRASLTGHLVFSTLHTNDAPGAITRLIDMGVEPFLVASAVELVIAQRLVRRLCPACTKPKPVDTARIQADLVALHLPASLADGVTQLNAPVGCRACRNTGFTGRLAIMEICMMTETLQEKINLRATSIELKAQALKDGMIPMRHYGFRKASQGITTLEEVMTVTAASE
jgi:general secretion pathway protein E/type IV pilus assembly protein PilB